VTFWHDGIAELFKRTGLDAVAQIALPHEKAACIERIIDHVADLARRKPAAFRLQMSRCMYDVLLLLLTEVHDYASEAEMPATLVRAMQFALDNIGRVTHTRELARTAGCSNAHFSRLFLRYVGIAPHRWLELNKMRAAAEMLCLSRKKVQLIAEAVGYLDPFHFSRVFKRSTGASPLEYRARFRRQHARA
jgi:AraC-like DNA-binding protein